MKRHPKLNLWPLHVPTWISTSTHIRVAHACAHTPTTTTRGIQLIIAKPEQCRSLSNEVKFSTMILLHVAEGH